MPFMLVSPHAGGFGGNQIKLSHMKFQASLTLYILLNVIIRER